MNLIIGISGAAGAGKTTVANFLMEHYGFEGRQFSMPLKMLCCSILRNHPMPGGNLTERGVVDKTPAGRWFLQIVGTDIVRHVSPDYWAEALFKDPIPDRCVIHDLRFKNEARAVRQRGGMLWRVDRLDQVEDPFVANHPSEQEWRTLAFDRVLRAKGGDIAALHEQAQQEIATLLGGEIPRV